MRQALIDCAYCTPILDGQTPKPKCVGLVTLHMARAQPQHEPMDEDDLRPADTAILDVLRDGRATKGMLVDESGYSRNTVYNRLEVLQAAGHVRVVHEATRLFELASDPRENLDET
jgi:transcriptional regulator of nitric oxide reductase